MLLIVFMMSFVFIAPMMSNVFNDMNLSTPIAPTNQTQDINNTLNVSEYFPPVDNKGIDFWGWTDDINFTVMYILIGFTIIGAILIWLFIESGITLPHRRDKKEKIKRITKTNSQSRGHYIWMNKQKMEELNKPKTHWDVFNKNKED